MAWNSSDDALENGLLNVLGDDAKQPPPSNNQQAPRMRIEVTAPPEESKQPSQPSQPSQPAQPSQPSQPEPVPDPPTLTESAAFSTLRMFHEMGLAGDSEDIFDDQPQPQQPLNMDEIYNNNMNGTNGINGINTNTNKGPSYNANQSTLNNMAMNGILAAVKEDAILTPIPESPQPGNGGMDGMNGMNGMNGTQAKQPNPLTGLNGVNGIMTYSNVLDGDQNGNNGLMGNGLFNPQMNAMMANGQIPKPIKGGKKNKDDLIADRDQWIINNMNPTFNNQNPNGTAINIAEYQETTPRKDNDVKDMDDYKEVTKVDLAQFESMLDNTEKLIDDMIEICNYNGYGLDDHSGYDDKKDRDDDQMTLSEEMRIKEEALENNIAIYSNYVSEQLSMYNFNLSSNAIVDLMGVKHTMSFRPNMSELPYSYRKDCNISSQGYVLYNNKRLTPHYFFNILDHKMRDFIDKSIAKIIRDYLRKTHFKMQQYEYPSSESLKGITPILIDHFEEQCKIYYKLPYNLLKLGESQMVKGINDDHFRNNYIDQILTYQQDTIENMDDNYCVIVFPNHKSHIVPGMWSRSVTYFDNVIRGTMFQFIENCTSIENNNGWGIVLLNPNKRYLESDSFLTKPKYDEPRDEPPLGSDVVTTETITVPRNESSFAHTIEMYKHFIKPIVINKWKCKLLLISHCDGGNDIIHLLESQQECHKDIIGIAMLDFYNWSLSEFTKKTKQIIEQKAAIYMSLYGSNESAYGLEPSANKSPVTIFRTANKEKRYSPCYNTESVIRFFKSKIELHKQK